MQYIIIKSLTILLLAIFFSCEKDVLIEDPKYSYYENNFDNYYQDSILTVLTYNVQLGFTASQDPWDKNQTGGTTMHIHEISEIIRQINPSIITLQEIPKNRYNTEVKKFIEALADSLNMNFAFGAHGKNDPTGITPVYGLWGNAILSKFPIVEIENKEVYYEDKWKKRSVLRAKIKFNNNLLMDVFSLHHSGTDVNEIENTMNFITSSNVPVLVGGDFNRYYGNSELNKLGKLQDIFNSKLNGIDRIYSSINDTIYKIGSISGSNNLSDHFACYAKLKLK